MDDSLKKVMRQAQSYWYVDGLTELATGALLVVLGLYLAALGLMGPTDTAAWLNNAGVPLLILCGALLGRWAVGRLKERLTYPRTGYVAYHTQRAGIKALAAVLGLVVSALLVAAVIILHTGWLKSIAPAIAAAIFIAVLGYQYGLSRFYWLAGYTLLLGLPLALLQANDRFFVAILAGGAGLGFLVCGGLTLRRYLATTRLAGKAAE
jgi:hypothetical protein